MYPLFPPSLRTPFAWMGVFFPLLLASAHLHADEPEVPVVEVIGSTQLPGLVVPMSDVPANVQTYGSEDMGKQHHASFMEYLDQNPTSININSAQGNASQPDMNFRGFTASPLLGLPQGLSIFQDGIRINEPFGDVVNWDLIPQSAIAKIILVPGSNPVFGLNTLGGAVAIQTKRGSAYPGGAIEISDGSFGRRSMEVEQGGKSGNWDYFFTGSSSRDRGWADHNPSDVKQLFGKAGYRTDITDIEVALTAADNRLEGTQTIPLSFADNPRQAYTFPDSTHNQLGFLSTRASHSLNAKLVAGASLYWRRYRNSGVSSNMNDDFGKTDPDSGSVDNVQATNDRSAIDQDSYGMGVQLTFLDTLFGKKNQFVIGASGDFGNARFVQELQDAQFTASRQAIGIEEYQLATDAKTRSSYSGTFFSDTLSLNRQWTITLSGRDNLARTAIADQTGSAPKLNGDHRFSRFNPAAGINFKPSERVTTYAAYNEGMRAPTPIELTCADPDAPCKLPNNFLADPPLKKIVSHTVEVGARGGDDDISRWSLAAYRTELHDDIQFINSSANAVNAGYFQNVGNTRRQGVELSDRVKIGATEVTALYSYTDATFQSPFLAPGWNNTSADTNGAIGIRPGNQIPGIPRHTFKLRVEYSPVAQWSIGTNAVFRSSIFARGDEDNRDARGKIPGYGIFNLDTRYVPAQGWELFGRIDNLFNRQYANFGILGKDFFTGPSHEFDGANSASEQFRGFGAPRGIWIGTRYSW